MAFYDCVRTLHYLLLSHYSDSVTTDVVTTHIVSADSFATGLSPPDAGTSSVFTSAASVADAGGSSGLASGSDFCLGVSGCGGGARRPSTGMI